MRWETYSERFSKKALEAGFSLEDIEYWLGYAKNLYEKDLPVIFDQQHLALLVGFKQEYLQKASNAPRKFYRTFSIPKKSGGERVISEPLPSLKEIQRWILEEILYNSPISTFAKAYFPGRSIRKNARFHVKQNIVLTVDIEDFYGSLRFKRVFSFFARQGYAVPVSTMLSNLCCLHGSLPQGAPTSPALSNLLMHQFDKRVAGFAIKHGIRYTRYADDMTFSGSFEPGMIIKFVRKVLGELNLRINERKIQLKRPHQRQEVTGAIVNEKLQAPRELRRELRQAVYYIDKYGLASHLDRTNNYRANHVQHYLGIANFILFLNPMDKQARTQRDILMKYLVD